MGRIDRYLLSQLMLVFGLASLVLVLVYWINRAVALFDQLIADGQSAWVFLEFTALALPSIIRIVMPIAAFAATVYAMNRLANDSELTIIRATGASPWRIARPVLVFGLFVGLLVSILVHVLVPASIGRLAARQAQIAETATARLLREGEFISPTPGLTLYIREVTPQGELRGVLLSDSREGDDEVTYTAASAYLVRAESGPQLVMLDGVIQRASPEDERLLVTSFADLAYDLGPLMPSSERQGRGSREVSTLELLSPTAELAGETGRSEGELVAEAHDRIAEALLAPAAALIAAGALMLGQFSRFGVWRQIILAVVLVILVRGVESAILPVARAEPSRWPLVYLPGAVGFAVAGVLLWLAAKPRRVRQEVPA